MGPIRLLRVFSKRPYTWERRSRTVLLTGGPLGTFSWDCLAHPWRTDGASPVLIALAYAPMPLFRGLLYGIVLSQSQLSLGQLFKGKYANDINGGNGGLLGGFWDSRIH